jgi:hypothetical protein
MYNDFSLQRSHLASRIDPWSAVRFFVGSGEVFQQIPPEIGVIKIDYIALTVSSIHILYVTRFLVIHCR